MPAPKRRIWLYPASDSQLEIVILGRADIDAAEADNAAAIYVHVRQLCETWPGWDRVETLTMGTAVVGLSVQLGKHASHGDLLAEAMRMFRGSNAIKWSGGNSASDSRCGMVGEW